jgi:DNA processing protein
MNHHLSRRWIAAARLCTRVDLRAVFARLERDFLLCSQADFVRAGLSPRQARSLMVDGAEAQAFPALTFLDEAYPAALRELDRPPAVVWLAGRAELLDRPMLAVVGSRACTPYGRRVAGGVGRAVAQAGGVLVSGAARGIDTAAHLGALEAGGDSVAVLGSGLGRDERPLVCRLRQGGLVLSELPPDTPASRWTFPARNRLIAALGCATVVCEAARRSGALHTANAALALGRDLLAVPDRVDAPASQGSLRLLREGAEPLLCAEQAAARVRPRQHPAGRLLRALDEPRGLEEIATRSGMDARSVTRLLAGLELTGTVRRLPGGRYARA